MKMALFFSKTPQTFEVVELQHTCLSNASDTVRFAGITPKNKVNRIKKSTAYMDCIGTYFESKISSKIW